MYVTIVCCYYCEYTITILPQPTSFDSIKDFVVESYAEKPETSYFLDNAVGHSGYSF